MDTVRNGPKYLARKKLKTDRNKMISSATFVHWYYKGILLALDCFGITCSTVQNGGAEIHGSF